MKLVKIKRTVPPHPAGMKGPKINFQFGAGTAHYKLETGKAPTKKAAAKRGGV